MKTVFLSIIAVVGLLVLGALGYLAFSKGDVAQTDFETEITPQPAQIPAAAPAIPAPPAVIPPAPIPVAPVPAPVAVPDVAPPAQVEPNADVIPAPVKPADTQTGE